MLANIYPKALGALFILSWTYALPWNLEYAQGRSPLKQTPVCGAQVPADAMPDYRDLANPSVQHDSLCPQLQSQGLRFRVISRAEAQKRIGSPWHAAKAPFPEVRKRTLGRTNQWCSGDGYYYEYTFSMTDGSLCRVSEEFQHTNDGYLHISVNEFSAFRTNIGMVYLVKMRGGYCATDAVWDFYKVFYAGGPARGVKMGVSWDSELSISANGIVLGADENELTLLDMRTSQFFQVGDRWRQFVEESRLVPTQTMVIEERGGSRSIKITGELQPYKVYHVMGAPSACILHFQESLGVFLGGAYDENSAPKMEEKYVLVEWN